MVSESSLTLSHLLKAFKKTSAYLALLHTNQPPARGSMMKKGKDGVDAPVSFRSVARHSTHCEHTHNFAVFVNKGAHGWRAP